MSTSLLYCYFRYRKKPYRATGTPEVRSLLHTQDSVINALRFRWRLRGIDPPKKLPSAFSGCYIPDLFFPQQAEWISELRSDRLCPERASGYGLTSLYNSISPNCNVSSPHTAIAASDDGLWQI